MNEDLTPKQLVFIDEYIRTKNVTNSYLKAYKNNIYNEVMKGIPLENIVGKDAKGTIMTSANSIFNHKGVTDEIARRISEIERNAIIADKTEVLSFYTSVMRGEVLDQFGLEASLSDRINAANQLAKFLILEPMKMQGKQELSNKKVEINFKPRAKLPN